MGVVLVLCLKMDFGREGSYEYYWGIDVKSSNLPSLFGDY